MAAPAAFANFNMWLMAIFKQEKIKKTTQNGAKKATLLVFLSFFIMPLHATDRKNWVIVSPEPYEIQEDEVEHLASEKQNIMLNIDAIRKIRQKGNSQAIMGEEPVSTHGMHGGKEQEAQQEFILIDTEEEEKYSPATSTHASPNFRPSPDQGLADALEQTEQEDEHAGKRLFSQAWDVRKERVIWERLVNMGIDVGVYAGYVAFKHHMIRQSTYQYIHDAYANVKRCKRVAEDEIQSKYLDAWILDNKKEGARIHKIKATKVLRPNGKACFSDGLHDSGAHILRMIGTLAAPIAGAIDTLIGNRKGFMENMAAFHTELKQEVTTILDRIQNHEKIKEKEAALNLQTRQCNEAIDAWNARREELNTIRQQCKIWGEELAKKEAITNEKNEEAYGLEALRQGLTAGWRWLAIQWKGWGRKAREIAQDGVDTFPAFAPVCALGALTSGTLWGGVPFLIARLRGIQVAKHAVKRLKFNQKLLAWASPPDGNNNGKESDYRIFQRYAACVLLGLDPEGKKIKYAGATLGLATWLFITYVNVYRGKTLAKIAMDNFRTGVWVGSLYGARKIMYAILTWPCNLAYALAAVGITSHIYLDGASTLLNDMQKNVQRIGKKLNIIEK